MAISFAGLILLGGLILLAVFGVGALASMLKGGHFARNNSVIAVLVAVVVGFFVLVGIGNVRKSAEWQRHSDLSAHAEQVHYAPAPPMHNDPVAFGPAIFRKFAMLVIVVLLAVPLGVGVSRLIRSNARIHPAILPKIGLALLAIPLIGFLVYSALGQPSYVTMPTPQPVAVQYAPNYYDAQKASEPRKTVMAEKATDRDRSADKPDEHQEPLTAESTAPEIPVAPPEKLPDWVNDSPQRKDNVYYEVVKARGIADPSMRYAMLNDKLLVTAQRYIDEVLLPHKGAAQLVTLTPEYLREKCNGGEFETRGGTNESYFRLKFDSDFVTKVGHEFEAAVAQDRLSQLTALGLAVFGLLGGAYTFLRMKPAAKAPQVVGN